MRLDAIQDVDMPEKKSRCKCSEDGTGEHGQSIRGDEVKIGIGASLESLFTRAEYCLYGIKHRSNCSLRVDSGYAYQCKRRRERH